MNEKAKFITEYLTMNVTTLTLRLISQPVEN